MKFTFMHRNPEDAVQRHRTMDPIRTNEPNEVDDLLLNAIQAAPFGQRP